MKSIKNVLFLRLRINTVSSMIKFSARAFLLTICISLFSSGILFSNSGYQIELTVAGAENAQVILGHYLSKSMYPDDTVKLDSKGYGVFSGTTALHEGMYIVYFPNGSYFEMMMGADQQYSISTDTSNYVENLKVNGSIDNEIFADFQLFMIDKQKQLHELQSKLEKAEDEKEKDKIKKELQELGDERMDKINGIIENNPGLFVSAFLKATIDPEVPDDLPDDPKVKYAYYKDHYFDNFDLSDSRLLYTPLYEDKMVNYLDKVVLQAPDTLIKEIDVILGKTRSDSNLYRFVLVTLFNKYAKSKYMGMDAVQVHLAENYYLVDAYWSDEKFLSDLKERVDKIKPLLLGKVAPNEQLRFVPDEHFKQAENDTALKRYPHAGSFMNIHDAPGEYTVLVFWEATCSHCKKVVPELYKLYNDTLKSMNVSVIAISTLFGEDGKVKWVDFVNDKNLYGWYNAWNPYDYKFKEVYDVRSTPQIFVLNKDKEIIGKKLGPENIVELINAYKKLNN